MPGGFNNSDGSRFLGSGVFCEPNPPKVNTRSGWPLSRLGGLTFRAWSMRSKPLWIDGSFSILSLPDEVGCEGYISVDDIGLATAAMKVAMDKWGVGGHGKATRPKIHHNDCWWSLWQPRHAA